MKHLLFEFSSFHTFNSRISQIFLSNLTLSCTCRGSMQCIMQCRMARSEISMNNPRTRTHPHTSANKWKITQTLLTHTQLTADTSSARTLHTKSTRFNSTHAQLHPSGKRTRVVSPAPPLVFSDITSSAPYLIHLELNFENWSFENLNLFERYSGYIIEKGEFFKEFNERLIRYSFRQTAELD